MLNQFNSVWVPIEKCLNDEGMVYHFREGQVLKYITQINQINMV